MVYLSLSVTNIKEALEYYSDKIGCFDKKGTDRRLVCNSGSQLIIDLIEAGTEEHRDVFEQDDYVKSSFCICSETVSSADLIKRLTINDVNFEERETVVGLFLEFRDPAGNSFDIFYDNSVLMNNA